MKNLHNIFIVIVLTFSCICFSYSQKKASWYFNEASKIHIGGKTDVAINLLEEGTRLWPYNPLIKNLLEELKKQKKDKNQQNQKQDQKQNQNQDQSHQQQQQQMANQQKKMSQEEAKRILEALKNDEKKTQKKVRQKAPVRMNVEKDW